MLRFLNRQEELCRLDTVAEAGGFAVVFGRRRVGKTRLLVEWAKRQGGIYTVADQSSPDLQRTYFALAVATRLPGFGEVQYRDWRTLLERLARDAAASGFRGPIVFDELPYLVAPSPELPSVLQSWLDHAVEPARLSVAIAGSSQRMMQGLVLDANAPLYGRASQILEVAPLDAALLPTVFGVSAGQAVEHFAAWGGVPRYWELAHAMEGSVSARITELVLDPLGPLHREPDRLLLEELPPAVELRPLLDAIGAGAHRVTEIAARIGRPATSLARPLERLTSMGLVRRDVPFGESPRSSKRSLYRIDDPFFRLWFRLVAPARGLLVSGTRASRARWLAKHWPGLLAAAWEDLCRLRVPKLREASPLGKLGPWGPASAWWHGGAPEWDLVAESLDGRRLLLGGAKTFAKPPGMPALDAELARLVRRPPPELPAQYARHELVRALFVAADVPSSSRLDGYVIGAPELLHARR